MSNEELACPYDKSEIHCILAAKPACQDLAAREIKLVCSFAFIERVEFAIMLRRTINRNKKVFIMTVTDEKVSRIAVKTHRPTIYEMLSCSYDV